MGQHKEEIWQRGDAREIMRVSRRSFQLSSIRTAAHVALASTHYSLIKRYLPPAVFWKRPLAAWHMWRASRNANAAARLAGDIRSNPHILTLDEVDVITTIWAKMPWPFGRPSLAVEWIGITLHQHQDRQSMKSHTKALLYITLGGLMSVLPDKEGICYEHAHALIPEIEAENSSDRDRQLARVLFAVGAHYFLRKNHVEGLTMIRRALELARKNSRDQEEKILSWMDSRGIPVWRR